MEIVYKEEKKQTEEKKIDILPKNIRQIGEPDHRLRLYVEDFVSTYLQKTATYKPELNRVCMLYGVEKEKNGHPVLFVQSAARIELLGEQKEHIMQDVDWKAAEGIRRKYFPGQKVLGLAVMCSNQGQLSLEMAMEAHRRAFTKRYQLLLWQDGSEKEEVFFNAENGELISLQGYYIYYEENKSMQEYMIAHNPTDADRVGEPDEHAVRDFRHAVERKHPVSRPRPGQLLRVAAAACVVLALAGAIRYLQRNPVPAVTGTESQTLQETWMQEEKQPEKTGEKPENSTVLTVQTDDPASVTAETENNAGQTQEENPSDSLTETMADSAPETSAVPDATANESSTVTETTQTEETTAGQTEPIEETTTEGYTTYRVQTGDTISSISQKYYGNMQMVRSICELNRIEKQDLIYTGQILLLP